MLSSNARTLLRALSPGPSTPARFVHASSSIHAQRSAQPKTSRQQLTPASELSGPRGRSQSRYGDSRPPGPARPAFVRDDLPHPEKTVDTRPQRRVSGRELADSDDRFFSSQGRRRTSRFPRTERNFDSSTFDAPRRSWRDDAPTYDGKDGESRSSFQPRQSREPWAERDERHERTPAQSSRDKLPWSQTRDLQDKAYAERQAKRESQAGFNKEESTPRKAKIHNPLEEEFDSSSENVSLANLPVAFESPPLLPGLHQCLKELIGDEARPTPIQALAIKHLIKHTPTAESGYRQALLASETGSGKSIAYMLPLLQGLKSTEPSTSAPDGPQRIYPQGSPRALVLAPTHELTRQLSGFAKKLSHIAKARIVCASRANEASTGGTRGGTAGDFAKLADAMTQSGDGPGQEMVLTPEMGGRRGVDVLMGTPNKLLELTRGNGWNKVDEKAEEGRRWVVRAPEVGLERVEWVIVDEADVLLDPDFQENTNKLLADISAARGHPIESPVKSNDDKTTTEETDSTPHDYPFNLLLTSATIPYSLSSYLDKHHPGIMRLVSPRIHKLPSTLKTEHVSYGQSGGNRLADVERRLRAVWATDAAEGREQGRVVVFVNKGTKVDEVRAWLDSKGVKCVGFNGKSDSRAYGSNRHLEGFLKPMAAQAQEVGSTSKAKVSVQNEDEPRVLVTTSLLSRGLDFDSSVRHVFILDSPRNMVDFLHRAGRSARAGQEGTVVLFGKTKGRGSQEGRDVRKRVKAFKA